MWNGDGVDDVIQPPALHKADVLRLSLVSKVQPQANMALAWLSTLVAFLDALPNPDGCTFSTMTWAQKGDSGVVIGYDHPDL